jgi:hypothetical protein
MSGTFFNINLKKKKCKKNFHTKNKMNKSSKKQQNTTKWKSIYGDSASGYNSISQLYLTL